MDVITNWFQLVEKWSDRVRDKERLRERERVRERESTAIITVRHT